ncbi:MAG: N-acetylmuramoyl-L-alanine amidase [Hespellia sp.]|nr:N-acetylmuramoyl-L-alanine amidase [Hespellia sp.]
MAATKRLVLCAVILCVIASGCAKEEKKALDVKIVTGDKTVTEGVAEEPEKEQRQSNGILIALDPGHQGEKVDISGLEPNAPGSAEMKLKASTGTSGTYTGIPEYQLTLDISLMVRDELEAQGYSVIMTREDNDTAISNVERAMLANDAAADVMIRIHANGIEDASVNGALALVSSASNPYVGQLYEESSRLAAAILDSYCESSGMKNTGIQENDTMTGINWSRIPVMILEMGFMTNDGDDLKMADVACRVKMVDGIVNGINLYFGQTAEDARAISD